MSTIIGEVALEERVDGTGCATSQRLPAICMIRISFNVLKTNHSMMVLSDLLSCGEYFPTAHHVVPRMTAHPDRNLVRSSRAS